MGYIYKITNEINSKSYIGKTQFSIERRFKEHIKDSKKEKICNRPLYKAFNRYGYENFKIEELFETNDRKKLCEKEIEFIEKYDTYKKGYNATFGGDGGKITDLNVYEVYMKNIEFGKIIDTAKYFNVTPNTIRNLLIENGFTPIKEFNGGIEKKKVKIIELDMIFNSLSEATKYVIKNNISKSKNFNMIKKTISKCILSNKKYRGLIIKYL